MKSWLLAFLVPASFFAPGCAASDTDDGPTCGDSLVEGSEACDDGNRTAGDGCSPTCVREQGFSCYPGAGACHPYCGDGLVVGDEVCDSGNVATQPVQGQQNCLYCSQLDGACGDGVVNSDALESCEVLGSPGCVNCQAIPSWRCDANAQECHQTGLAPGSLLSALTAAELDQYCDWLTYAMGGVGESVTCHDANGNPTSVISVQSVSTCTSRMRGFIEDGNVGACTIADLEAWANGQHPCKLVERNPGCWRSGA